MSAIHVQTLIEALYDGPMTLLELSEKTGYPVRLVLQYITEARVEGRSIFAVMNGEPGDALPSTFELREQRSEP
jgi:hypothetical protein